jgi:serine phosphatase RsbU (regulator of sigma subunit)
MILPESHLEPEGEARVEAARSGINPELAVAIFRTTFVVMVVATLSGRGGVVDLLSPLYVTILLAGVYNAALLVMYWRRVSFPGQRHFILSLDIVFITLWVGLSGHTGLAFFPLYYALAVIAALWFGTVGALATAIVSGALYVAVLAAAGPDAAMSAGDALRERVPFLVLVALLSGYVADAQKRERQTFERTARVLAAYRQQRRLMQDFYDLVNPQALASPPDLEVGVAFRPALRMGAGDYYDLLHLDGGRYGLCVADVAGKHGAEVLRVPVVKYALKVAAMIEPGPAHVVERVNQLVFDELQPDRFVTMFYAQVDPSAGAITYVNAGHDPALLVRASGATEALASGGLVLGVLSDARYEEGRLRWTPQDALVLYTDGAVEARGAGTEEFGADRFRETACAALAAADSAAAAAQAILAAIERYAAGGHRRDDITIMVARSARPAAKE